MTRLPNFVPKKRTSPLDLASKGTFLVCVASFSTHFASATHEKLSEFFSDVLQDFR
jgi:hypothetical protein